MEKQLLAFGFRGYPHIQGGAEKHAEQLYNHMTARGWRVKCIVRAPYFPRPNRTNKSFVYLWAPKISWLETPFHSFFATLYCMFSPIRNVHIHNIGACLFIPLLWLARKNVIVTIHSFNYYHRKWNLFAKLVFRVGEYLGVKFAKTIIIVSRYMSDILKKKYPNANIVYIPNGVTLPTGKETGIRKLYNIEDKKYLLTVGRICEEKGTMDIVKAYLQIKVPEYKLVIVGDRDFESPYTRQTFMLADGVENILFTGTIYGDGLEELYAHATLFITASTCEGAPIALLEAIAHNVPVLVSRIPAHKELPINGVRYFDVGDIDDMAIRIQALAKLGMLNDEITQLTTQVTRKYNWNTIAYETEKIFKGELNV